MRARVQKWGHSLALRIPKPFAIDAGVGEGSVVEMSVSEGRLVAAPVRVRKVHLRDLLAKVTRANLHDEVDSGARVGREAW
ncbi:MAG: AbrB/MazE/SpoVT family DNA-binding domain-containing protein [bacterium]